MRTLKFIFFLFILILGMPGHTASNDNLNTILELESKITLKIRSLIQPVDPDAIVIAKVEVQKINTELAGTQMSAVGILSTADLQSVEDGDIQTISVSIISAIDPFPDDIKKLVESTLKGFSKKGKVKIVKMTDSMVKAIIGGKKNKSELTEQLSQLTKKFHDFADTFKNELLILFLQFVGSYALIQGVILFFQRRFQGNSIRMLKDALSSLNINTANKGSEDTEASQAPLATPGAEDTKSGSSSLNGSITTKDNPIEQMYIQLIRDLISDCYWCFKDNYAAWVWSQLSPPKRMELLESWEPIIYYVKYFTHLEPQMDNYHLDPVYLKPREYFMHSNDDLLEIVRLHPYLWGEISILRQKAFRISLKERIDFMKAANKVRPEKAFEWPYTPSKLRVLHTQLEVSELSSDDEAMIIQDPSMVPDGYRDNLHSLIWTAMLPQEERDKLLQRIPAQALAEIWIGPEDVLFRLNEVLPAKKQELLKSYLQRTTPSRSHPSMKYLSGLSLKRFRELYPPPPEIEEVVLPKLDLDRPQSAMSDDTDQMIDVDALVAAFKEGQLEEESTPSTEPPSTSEVSEQPAPESTEASATDSEDNETGKDKKSA